MHKHKSNKIKENSNTVRHLTMGQITTTQNLVAIKEVRHAGQSVARYLSVWDKEMYMSKDDSPMTLTQGHGCGANSQKCVSTMR